MRRIEIIFEHTDLEELFKEDQYLLHDFCLETLIAAISKERILWEEKMQAAKSATRFCQPYKTPTKKSQSQTKLRRKKPKPDKTRKKLKLGRIERAGQRGGQPQCKRGIQA